MLKSFRRTYSNFITSGAQLLLLYIGLETGTQRGWVICLALIALVSLPAWISTLSRRRIITDTPTSRIASAAQGYTELSGTGIAPEGSPLLAPFTQIPCLWYRHRVEKRSTHDEWEVISEDESNDPFILNDGSGHCLVDVEGAEILTRHKESATNGDFRNTEWKLLINDNVYAIGDFKTIGGGAQELDSKADLNDLLAEWKKNKTDLIKRFDLNGDGEIDMKEWGLARQAARREVSKMHAEARNHPGLDTLCCPNNGRYFLISNYDPNKLAFRYLLWAGFHSIVFLAALGSIPWVLSHPL